MKLNFTHELMPIFENNKKRNHQNKGLTPVLFVAARISGMCNVLFFLEIYVDCIIVTFLSAYVRTEPDMALIIDIKWKKS